MYAMNSKKFQLDGLGVSMTTFKTLRVEISRFKTQSWHIYKKKIFINYYTRDKIKFLSGVSNFELKKFFFGLMWTWVYTIKTYIQKVTSVYVTKIAYLKIILFIY